MRCVHDSAAHLIVGALGFLAGCGSSGPPNASTDGGRVSTEAGHEGAAHPMKDAATHDVTDARSRTDALPDGHTAADAGFNSIGPDGGWIVAPHAALPQVIPFGGSVVAAPVFTAVTFEGYDLTTEAESIVDGIGATAYWTSTVGEYGVGAATATAPVELTTSSAPGSINDTGVQSWLLAALEGSDGAPPILPAPTPSSVYVLLYPAATTVSFQGAPACQHFGGYHSSLTLPSSAVVTYVVVAECDFGAGTSVAVSETLAHEMTAATTDPSPLVAPAYGAIDPNDLIWGLIAGGPEVPDLCSPFSDSVFTPTGYPYTLERVWSDKNAAASHDPCQPAPAGEVYFNATTHLTGMVYVTSQGSPTETLGVVAPLNQPTVVEVNLYSDGPTEPWTVAANDLSSVLGGGPYLSFSWDRTQGQNGTTLHLTITPLQATALYGGEVFDIASTLGTTTKHWYGFVAQEQ
jgi:hypothetical protein